MKLTIVSHTRHYLDADGRVWGWPPTIRELDFLATRFDEVVHVACLHRGAPPVGSAEYQASNVRFVPIPPSGGIGTQKLTILWSMPKIIRIVMREILSSDFFQLRTPTSMAVYLLPLIYLFARRKQGWFKYAGNWKQCKSPMSYRLQRWWLERIQHRIVTINGNWPNQYGHCLAFENPCLSEKERGTGEAAIVSKKYDLPIDVCFVGRLEEEKGVGRVIEALRLIDGEGIVSKAHFVGDGKMKSHYENLTADFSISCEFYGFLSREKIFSIYEKSHLLLLPSESEGFPKVVAEAANFGCVPVVSNVSCIPQYVNQDNGYLWNQSEDFAIFFSGVVRNLGPRVIQRLAIESHKMAEAFTFDKYISRIMDEIVRITKE